MQTIFAACIRVQITGNVFQKVEAAVVFARRPITETNVVKVNVPMRIDCRMRTRRRRRSRLVHRPNPCDNVYCGYGQCHEGICECQQGYSGSRCDTPRTYGPSTATRRVSSLSFSSQLTFAPVSTVTTERATKVVVRVQKATREPIAKLKVR